MFTKKSIAKDILEDTKRIYVETHWYKVVDQADFRHLDLGFYETAMRKIEAHRFRQVADVENLTLKESTVDPRTFIRVGLSFDGTIQSAIYQIKPKWWFRLIFFLTGLKLGKTIEFETEFSDGSFVVTSNARNAALFDSPPLIDSEFLPDEISVEVLVERHRTRIEDHIYKTDASPVQLFSLKDVLESQHRMEKIKSDFRRRVGWIKKSEWDRMKPPLGDDAYHNEIYAEFEDLRNKTASE